MSAVSRRDRLGERNMRRALAGVTEHDGRLAVTCWCERAVLLIDARAVRRGETGSCGPGCKPR